MKRRHWKVSCAAAAIVGVLGSASREQALAGNVSFSSVTGTVTSGFTAPNGYGADDINSCSIDLNNLISFDGFQYIAYYGPANGTSATSTAPLLLGRRADPTTANPNTSWSVIDSGLTMAVGSSASSSAGNTLLDDHNIIALGVDNSGDLHMAWGMHNTPLNGSTEVGYYISASGAATGSTWSAAALGLTKQTVLADGGTNETEVTYPEFYNQPGTNDLIFTYRQGGAGGGSGNGDSYFDDYTPGGSPAFTSTRVIDGMDANVNAYLNSMVYTPTGNLLLSWTWRATPNWQTNSNIMFAQSPNNGVSWFQQGGTTQYTLPITPAGTGTAAQQAQVVWNIPQNSSFINQTSMTYDTVQVSGSPTYNPMIASYLAPGWNATTSTGNPNRQYMLFYYDPTRSQWRSSQISNRISDISIDTSGNDVRDLGRPIVMVDSSGRVLVVTRSEDVGMGDYAANLGANQNNIVVYYNTVTSLDSANPLPWQPITLDSANMGESEPTYDSALWAKSNILDLFYQSSAVDASTASVPVQVLQWNEAAYFAAPTPTSLFWDSNTSGALQDGSGTWNTSSANFSDGTANYKWNNSTMTAVTFGVTTAAAGTVTLGSSISVQDLTFDTVSSGNYTIAGGGFTLTLLSGSVINTNANATISAPLSGTNLLKVGPGTLTLSGNNSALTGTLTIGTGITTSGGNLNGTVRITTAAAVSGFTKVAMPDYSGTFDIFMIDSSGGTAGITLPSTLGFSLSGEGGTNTTANRIESVASASATNEIDGSISITVGGNQYAVQSDAGTLLVTSGFNLGSLSSRFLDLQGAGNGKWSGVLSDHTSGSGQLEISKYDGGTWTLSNTNTYTGPTLVSGGTLAITGAIGSTSVTVLSGALLNAAGTSNDGLPTGAALTVSGTAAFADGILGGGITPRTVSSVTISNGGLVQVVNPASHADRQVLITSGLTFGGASPTWQGILDLAGNDLIVHNTSATTAATELTNITSQLAQGLTNGWQGTGGIVSSSAAAVHNTALAVELNNDGSGGTLTTKFDNQTVTTTDVLVKYTYFGDANLDGVVNAADYTLIDNGFNSSKTGWRNGDFNYDGVVNGDDYTLIDNAFNTQGSISLAGVSAGQGGPTAMIASDTDQIAAVPEPMSLSVLGLGAAGMLLRRRKRA